MCTQNEVEEFLNLLCSRPVRASSRIYCVLEVRDIKLMTGLFSNPQDLKESNQHEASPVLSSLLFCLSLGAMSCFADPPKVIIDTDFNTIGDDGQVAIMASQL